MSKSKGWMVFLSEVRQGVSHELNEDEVKKCMKGYITAKTVEMVINELENHNE